MNPIKTRFLGICCLLVLAVSFSTQATPGQPGTLDTTWGGTGQVATSVSGNSYATAMTLQPDGKVLVAGYCAGGGNAELSRFKLRHYLIFHKVDFIRYAPLAPIK